MIWLCIALVLLVFVCAFVLWCALVEKIGFVSDGGYHAGPKRAEDLNAPPELPADSYYDGDYA